MSGIKKRYNHKAIYKVANDPSKLPKVNRTSIKRAKSVTLDDNESHSLRRAIERSKSPKNVTKEVSKSTESIYAGGNTASNMRGVMRSENKKLNEVNKKRYGRTASGFKSRSLNR